MATDAVVSFLKVLKNTPGLTRQQYKTLKGQALAGDVDGAYKGYGRILEKRKGKNAHRKDKRGAAKPRHI